MGRKVCCGDRKENRREPWTAEEDQKLINYIQLHGPSNWPTLPKIAGLSRSGKSCRLRWTNCLRTDIKRGTVTAHEDLTVIRLHEILGNKWSAIAFHIPGRTDNQIKNRWNTKLKKQLLLMGIDPVTHRPLPTPDDMYSVVASSSTVESSIVARCNTVVVESELRRTEGGYVNNMCNRQPSQIQNPLTTINNTVKPPVWAEVPGARLSCENSLPLPSISMDRLLPPSTSGWLHGLQNEINQDFNSRLNNRIEYNAFSQEALQFSNLERKSEDVADMNSFSGIPNNLENKAVVFRNRLPSDAETMCDECKPSCKGGTSEILENAIQYHPDDPFGSSIITARADVLNKECENSYWYNLLNLIENDILQCKSRFTE